MVIPTPLSGHTEKKLISYCFDNIFLIGYLKIRLKMGEVGVDVPEVEYAAMRSRIRDNVQRGMGIISYRFLQSFRLSDLRVDN